MTDDPDLHAHLDPALAGEEDERERRSQEAFGLEEPGRLPRRGHLLSFYDRLREQILKAVEGRTSRSGKLTEAAVRALLLVPDIFILLVRLMLDKEVPGSARAMIGGALAYFLLPIDLLPEAMLGPAGFLDDLVLAAAVLAQAFGGELEPYARKHWNGPEDLRVVLQDLTEAAQSLLGTSVYERLKRLLSRRGVTLGDD